MTKKPFGYELLLDLYDCDPITVNDLRLCYDFLEGAVRVLHVHQQSPPFIFQSPTDFPDKAGLSGWIPLIESGIQIHTLTVKNFISIDYYTCSEVDEKMKNKLLQYAQDTFRPKKLEMQFLRRGTMYFDK